MLLDDVQVDDLLARTKERGGVLRQRRRRAGELAVLVIAVCGSLAWGGPSYGASAPAKVAACSVVAHGPTSGTGHIEVLPGAVVASGL